MWYQRASVTADADQKEVRCALPCDIAGHFNGGNTPELGVHRILEYLLSPP